MPGLMPLTTTCVPLAHPLGVNGVDCRACYRVAHAIVGAYLREREYDGWWLSDVPADRPGQH